MEYAPCDRDHAISHFVCPQHVENGLAGGSGRLAIIAHAFRKTSIGSTTHRGIGDMPGFRMLVTDRLNESERLIQRADMTGVSDEFRFLFDEGVVRRPIGGIEYGLHAVQPT